MFLALITAINSSTAEDRTVLVNDARNGSQDAMQELYGLYSKAMLNTSYRILNRREDAEDALQESFLKAFSHLDQYNSESTFGAWLKRIVVNQSLDMLKKKERLNLEEEDEISDEIDEPSFREDCTLQDKLDLLYKGLHQMPTGYRTVFSLYMIEGYDHEEIGKIMGIGVSTSISQLSRAKNKLKLIIENLQSDE
ncbi:sigma-70 family RNA polymerase sigma factor [Crocinitomix catalasitica]|nr:sigma-70 family RNA polymerase sigma factor [Crocinitomix catalasitica]